MAAIHETAYPRIKPNLNRRELKEIFTPTQEELILLDSKTKKTLRASPWIYDHIKMLPIFRSSNSDKKCK